MNFLKRTSLKLEALSVRGLGGEKGVSLDPGGGGVAVTREGGGRCKTL